jgi:hypothetical protein
MFRTLGMSLSLVFGALLTTSCSTSTAICEAVCECEHCNKYAELAQCRSAEKAEAIADAYGCSDKYEAVAECTLSKGTCDEKTANFSTIGEGTCTDNPTGISCATDADCSGDTCVNTACVERRCNGSGSRCSTGADCIGEGTDGCADEKDCLVCRNAPFQEPFAPPNHYGQAPPRSPMPNVMN